MGAHYVKVETGLMFSHTYLSVAALFLLANETIGYLVAPSAYWVGALGLGYLYCALAIIVSGTVINTAFVAKPTPRMAGVIHRLSLGVLGILYVLGMVLGRKG